MNETVTYGLTHIALQVRDLERTLKFYQHIFGMEVMYSTSEFLQLTTPGCHDILVFEKHDQVQGFRRGGIMHFGFRLREASAMEEVLQKINETGATILDQGEFLPGAPYVFFEDPDGYEIEVWYELLSV